MIPVLRIDRLARGVYRGSVAGRGVDMTEPVIFDSIAEALKFFGDDMPKD